jgi:hypothetical protein
MWKLKGRYRMVLSSETVVGLRQGSVISTLLFNPYPANVEYRVS